MKTKSAVLIAALTLATTPAFAASTPVPGQGPGGSGGAVGTSGRSTGAAQTDTTGSTGTTAAPGSDADSQTLMKEGVPSGNKPAE